MHKQQQLETKRASQIQNPIHNSPSITADEADDDDPTASSNRIQTVSFASKLASMTGEKESAILSPLKTSSPIVKRPVTGKGQFLHTGSRLAVRNETLSGTEEEVLEITELEGSCANVGIFNCVGVQVQRKAVLVPAQRPFSCLCCFFPWSVWSTELKLNLTTSSVH